VNSGQELGEALRKFSPEQRKLLSSEEQSRRSEYLEERVELLKASQASMASYDKSVLAVASVGLGFSMKLGPPTGALSCSLLVLLWLAFATAIVATVYSLKASHDALREEVVRLGMDYQYDIEKLRLKHTQCPPEAGFLQKLPMAESNLKRYLCLANYLSFRAFIVGLIATLLYSSIVSLKGPSMSEADAPNRAPSADSTPATENRGYVPPPKAVTVPALPVVNSVRPQSEADQAISGDTSQGGTSPQE